MYFLPSVILCVLLAYCDAALPFWDTSLSFEKRVTDLVSRLTLDEVVDQLAYGGRLTHAPGIPRLGIKPYPWGSECLHGDASAGLATSFPQALGLAASFSREVLFNVSQATGREVRAKFNNYSREHDYGQHTSASCWSPVINIIRDPRWGRNQETYGEDPYLTGELAASFVRGLQGNHPRYVRANAGCKHYAAYAGPENIPVSEYDLQTTFLPAFRSCVEAGTLSLMCSYNAVNGVPACANKRLLQDTLRDRWGFSGYVISDEGAIIDIKDSHHYVKTTAEAAAVAVNAGCNLEDGPFGLPPYFASLRDAYKQKLISEATLRNASKPLFYTRMKIGEFDPWNENPYYKLKPEDYVQSAAHREIAVLTAMRTFVLLKNDGTLPLKKKVGRIAVVGPFADNIQNLFSEYAPDPDSRYVVTVAEGLRPLAGDVIAQQGCAGSDVQCRAYDAEGVKKTVVISDMVVVTLGTGPAVEGEGNDRTDIELPGLQGEMLQEVLSVAGGKPVIVLLFNGGPLNVSAVHNDKRVKVIMECFFPGQATGEALRRVFLNEGPGANPAGRLPNTWYGKLSQLSPITDYTMVGRTYQYLTPGQSVIYPFGYGLSYSTFHYSSLRVTPTSLWYPNPLYVEVYVQNTAAVDGEEVIQVFISWPYSTIQVPLKPRWKLVAFSREFIPARSGVNVRLRVDWSQLATWSTQSSKWENPTGVLTLHVGGQQPQQQVQVPGSNVLQQRINVNT